MRIAILLTCLLAGTIPAGLRAQSTLIVSSSGGGQYTDVQPAVDAASPGDTIVVRAGFYQGFTVSKGVRLLVDPGAEFGLVLGPPTSIVFDSIPAGQTALLRGVSVIYRPNPIAVTNCAGHVHIESCALQTGVAVADSLQVSLQETQLVGAPALRADNSTVLVTQCDLQPLAVPGVMAALECTQSTVVFAHGTIQGTPPVLPGLVMPGVRLHSGELTIAGDSQSVVAAGGSPGAHPAIEILDGTLVLDPAVTLIPHNGAQEVVVQGGSLVPRSTPSLRTDLTAQQLTVETFASPGSTSVLVIGLVQSPPVALPFGYLWFGFHVPIDSGVVPAGGVRTFSLAIQSAPAGIEAVLQAVVVTPTSLELSVPVVRTFDG